MAINKVLFTGSIAGTLSGIGVYELLLIHPETSNLSQDIDSTSQYDEEGLISTPSKNNQTYKDIFASKNLSVVNSSTTTEQMRQILVSRMFPHYKRNKELTQGQLLPNSPVMTLTGKDYTNNQGKKLFIIENATDDELKKLKQVCLDILNTETQVTQNHYKVREWCVIPTIKSVLFRHKFQIPSKDEEWKQILESDWIKKEDYHSKQSFFTTEELNQLTSGNDTTRIQALKNKCTAVLGKQFSRSLFPATTEFLNSSAIDGLSGKKVDEFQEAALFCTVPTTAQSYIDKAMKGIIKSGEITGFKDDYCLVDGKNKVDDYKDIKTTDPMEGKSFWCAVRLIYYKGKEQGTDN